MNWQLFFEGDDYYAALRADIAAARIFIGIESYIFEDDEIGLEIMEALLHRAAEGLTVRIIADGVGFFTRFRRIPFSGCAKAALSLRSSVRCISIPYSCR